MKGRERVVFKTSPPPLSFLSLFLFYLSCLSVSVSRVCAPTLPLTNKVFDETKEVIKVMRINKGQRHETIENVG